MDALFSPDATVDFHVPRDEGGETPSTPSANAVYLDAVHGAVAVSGEGGDVIIKRVSGAASVSLAGSGASATVEFDAPQGHSTIETAEGDVSMVVSVDPIS